MSEPISQPDVVVIGAGVGGLAAAGYLAREGLRVAVCEKHSKAGGYMQYFGSEPRWDSTTHLLPGHGPGSWLYELLGGLGDGVRIGLHEHDRRHHERVSSGTRSTSAPSARSAPGRSG